MSSTYYKLKASTSESIRDIGIAMREYVDAENVGEQFHSLGDANVYILSMERYFFRNGSYAGLTVVLTEHGTEKTADIIGSGGGEGFFNVSWGANTDFANKAAEILRKFGFRSC